MADRTSEFANAFETTLAAELGSTAMSANVVDASGLTAPCYLVLDIDVPASREYVRVSAIATNTLTLSERYLTGSAAGSGITHTSGAKVSMALAAQAFEDVHDRITAVNAALVTDHGALTGLADDDHTQYHIDSRALTWHTALPGSHVTNGDTHDHAGGDGAQVDHGGLAGLTDDDHTQYHTDARALIWHDADDHSTLDTELSFAESGTLTVKAGTMRWYAPFAISIQDVRASVSIAPTGADLICDVNKGGTTIFTTQAGRPQIVAGNNTAISNTPNVQAVAAGEYLTVDIDQIGSTVAGSDLVVTIRYRRA